MIYCEDCSSYECGCPERKEIESLRQQLNACRQLKQAYIDELADMQKREVMLREVMQEVLDTVWLKTSHELARKFSEALAATDDLEGLRLCHAEPTIETLSVVTNTGYVYVRAIDRKVEPNTKLFSAWEPKP